MQNQEEILLMIRDCHKRQSKLTPWELNFINSIAKPTDLSQRQITILENIWERVT